MPLNEVSGDRVFRGLKCAYTGKPVTVRVVASAGRMPCYFSPDAFDPAVDAFPTAVDLFKALSQRDGVAGIAPEDRALVCPYSGERMTLTRSAAGFTAVGGFSPARLYEDKTELARGLMMRGGVVPEGAPKPARVSAAALEEPERRPPIETGPGDMALDEAERALHDVYPSKVSVTMPVKAPSRKKAKKKR